MPAAKRAKRASTPEPVVIVGGGVMGCAAAYELSRAGKPVIVLERSVPGAEASSAAAGILGAQVEAHHPGPLTELGLASAKLYPALIADLQKDSGVSVGYRRCGVLKVAYAAPGLKELVRERAWQKRQKLAMEQLSPAALRKREPGLSPELAGGLWFEGDATLEPRSLLSALRVAAEKGGVQFRSGAFVERVEEAGGRAVGVRLSDGSVVRGSHVVLAAGSWTSLVSRPASEASRVVPARGQIVELRSSVPPLSAIVFGPDCYLVPRADGRVLVGSTLEFVGYKREVTAGAVSRLLNAALRLVPALEQAELSSTWSSFRPYTADELPLLGPSQTPGLIFMSGHYRNGILLAPISARIVAACVTGQKPPVDLLPFAPDRATTRP
ncbi:MAG: glycine oxidase ThiO [Myxococcales bacterium]|nr:MAG: glycine oxidase ThiO [Myxococcales bacterium]